MKNITEEQQLLNEVFDKAGGVTALAESLKCSRSSIYKWKRVPPDRCTQISMITDIPVERLRPDVFTNQPVVRELRGIAALNEKRNRRKKARRDARAKLREKRKS